MEMNHSLRSRIYTRYGRDFQDASDTFDTAAARRWARAYRWYLRGWLPTRKDAAIADLACGQGRMLFCLRELGYTNLWGVDISPDQVALARQVTPRVHEQDVLRWLSPSAVKFDLLIALDFIEHLTRDEAVQFLDLSSRALNPGGRLVLQTPNADSPFALHHADITHEFTYNTTLLTRLLRRSGFSCIEPREQGPVPLGYSIRSTMRWLAWRAIRAGLQLWNLAETGGTLPILTRVFLISAVAATYPESSL